MSKINILMVGNDPKIKGGISSVITQLLAHEWAYDSVDMTFVPTYGEGSVLHKALFFGKAYLKIKNQVKQSKPDLVHIHMSYRGSFTRKNLIHRLCKKYKIPDVLHLHGSEFKDWYDGLNKKRKEKVKRLLRESGAVIVLGDNWNNIIKAIEPQAETFVVRNSVHIPPQKAVWNEQRFQILFMGVLIERKGVSDLLQAIKIVANKNIKVKMQVVIAGTGVEEEKLKRLSQDLGIDQIVNFKGWVTGDDKDKLFKESQILILPSYNEGLPVTVLEAISYGLPVISTNVGDICAAVHNGKNGFIVSPGDINGVAESIYRIVCDKELYLCMCNESKKIAEEEFSDSQYFLNILNCYRKVLNKNRTED